jgi:alpha-L-fucosidase
MRYGVLTTKHHDGYALFPSEHGDFGSPRDLVREFVDAFRAEGLRVGFYYSLSDWHHPDYPAFTEDDRPYFRYLGRRSSAEAWARYQDYLFGHLRELLTNYGDISVLWFDGQWERSMDEWRAEQLGSMIRELQPGILVNDRLPGQGDIETPEQFVPAQPPKGRWETCMTMNRSWGYVPDDEEYKSARDLVHTLCETASRGGNLLLNIAPRGDGSVPPEQVERLAAVATWMDTHHDAIYGTAPGLEPWQFYGPSTRRGDRIFLHLLMRPYESVTVRGLPIRHVTSVRNVATGDELSFTTRCSAQDMLTNTDPIGDIVVTVPESMIDPYATVLEIQGENLLPA